MKNLLIASTILLLSAGASAQPGGVTYTVTLENAVPSTPVSPGQWSLDITVNEQSGGPNFGAAIDQWTAAQIDVAVNSGVSIVNPLDNPSGQFHPPVPFDPDAVDTFLLAPGTPDLGPFDFPPAFTSTPTALHVIWIDDYNARTTAPDSFLIARITFNVPDDLKPLSLGPKPGANTVGTIQIDSVTLQGAGQFFSGTIYLDAAAESPADLNGDGDVDGFDLAMLLGQWTGAATYAPCPPAAAADLNGDCKINGFDLAILLAAWS